LTAEQLEASRAERMRQNGHGALTLEDARTWIEETGLCLFLPRRQFSSSIAPSFVEAVGGHQNATPDPKHIALAEELLVRLETDGVAVRLNLHGQPGEQPDFVVAAWVLPYVYALRGDRDWRRIPQLTGSRQVSQLAVQAYKQLETGDATIATLTRALGREVTEGAVLRAITELWQQLRIIPVVSAPGKAAQWQLLRTRFQKAIAEGASTSQVTAISVLASIYLQAVIAASMEEVELFLAPLTARSKVREVLRGLVATRQVHTISLGHAPHFYVAGTLPEFDEAPTSYTSSSMPASAYFQRSRDHEEDAHEFVAPKLAASAAPATPARPTPATEQDKVQGAVQEKAPDVHTPRIPAAGIPAARIPAARIPAARKPASNGKPAAARPHFSRPAAHSRDRKPVQSSSSRPGARPARRAASDARPSAARPTGTRQANGSRPAAGLRPANGTRWSANGAKSTNGKHHLGNGAGNGTRNGNGAGNGLGNGHSNGAKSNGIRSNGSAARPANGASRSSSTRTTKPSAAAWGKRNGHTNGHSNGHINGAKAAGKPSATSRGSSASQSAKGARSVSATRGASATRNGSATTRNASRPALSGRKPALTASTKAGNSKRFGFTARPKAQAKPRPKQETKKRG
jgi:23S rRNA pseudouridine2605 synthase